ncbi:hypothetical protein APY04_3063 [Hyphomicrobium sulfonivorans]|uniref:Uncharacterized protein n=1 Tax=Hyphomicrobium sulfonivorans TaxID=121290 RepID=A0A120CTP3_HYPSL|nr:hypothetical protein [Hyphomicrobium sulfonivorans]KWT64975.1 hypothetical protein APY04_3063 [Hyphomicrobium sulfonivorans]
MIPACTDMKLPAGRRTGKAKGQSAPTMVRCVRALTCGCALLLCGLLSAPASAQMSDFDTSVERLRGAFPPDTGRNAPADSVPGPSLPTNTTVVPRAPAADGTTPTGSQVNLTALLTVDGQRIDSGVIWRVYAASRDPRARAKPLITNREPSPTIELDPGEYIVNAAFGRADITRKIVVTAGTITSEKFVLNAGGLKVKVLVDGAEPPTNTVAYDILSSERDQLDNRMRVLAGAKPNIVNRLNAGIYRIVSRYGDANAKVEADVTVEAGKLTEATVTHAAARVTFKLVAREGGVALPDTQWTVQTPDGQLVMRSVGALPTHILAPGTYAVTAKGQSGVYKRDFTLADGDIAHVEVVMQ